MPIPVLHSHLADNMNHRSLAARLRRRRFGLLRSLLAPSGSTMSVLDVGGRSQYWDSMLDGTELEGRLKITLLNLDPPSQPGSRYHIIAGDARSMPQFGDGEFDLVFSNSTIEHVGDLDDQMRMAQEIRRVGQRYYVQTPNRHFPIEPHYVFPLFHYLPLPLRASLVQRAALGWMPRHPGRAEALAAVSSIKLLSSREMQLLFPDASILEEQLAGLVKSIVAYTP